MQVFYVLVPLNIMYDFLDKVSAFDTKHYFFDQNSFKRMIYMNLYEAFLASLKEYMKPAKYIHYKTKPLTYMLIVSLLKEICKLQSLTIQKKNGYYIEFRE